MVYCVHLFMVYLPGSEALHVVNVVSNQTVTPGKETWEIIVFIHIELFHESVLSCSGWRWIQNLSQEHYVHAGENFFFFFLHLISIAVKLNLLKTQYPTL